MSPVLIHLVWSRYSTLTDARRAFKTSSCIYVQTDSTTNPVCVGKASKGLVARYHGGTGYALDAAMHQSANFVFVAPVSAADELIWQHRDLLIYNNIGKKAAPSERLVLVHEGMHLNSMWLSDTFLDDRSTQDASILKPHEIGSRHRHDETRLPPIE